MSALEENVQVEPLEEIPVRGPSLRDEIAAQERQIQQEPAHAIIVPLSWLTGFAVQYRALSQREMYPLEKRHDKNPDEYEQGLFIAADKLLHAQERIVKQTGPDEYSDTGYKLGPRAAQELFDRTLPEKATARQGLLAIFPEEEILFDHFLEYERQRKLIRTKVDKKVTGEFEAGSAQT